MRSSRRALVLGLTSSLLLAAGIFRAPSAAADDPAKVINLYSARLTPADNQLYQLFTQQTGIKINAVQGKPKELLQRILMQIAPTQTRKRVFLPKSGDIHRANSVADSLPGQDRGLLTFLLILTPGRQFLRRTYPLPYSSQA